MCMWILCVSPACGCRVVQRMPPGGGDSYPINPVGGTDLMTIPAIITPELETSQSGESDPSTAPVQSGGDLVEVREGEP